MGYSDPEKQKEYQRNWVRKRREAYFADKCCVFCGSTIDLQLDHIDPTKKVAHAIWSWSEKRRQDELLKCQVLCEPCHRQKSIEDQPVTNGWKAYRHGTLAMYHHHKCRCGLCRLKIRNYFRERRAVNKQKDENAR